VRLVWKLSAAAFTADPSGTASCACMAGLYR
jgi:hypothetical protein